MGEASLLKVRFEWGLERAKGLGGGLGKPFQPKRPVRVREWRRPGVHWLREGLNGGGRLMLES